MNGSMDDWMDGGINGWINGSMDDWMDGGINGWMNGYDDLYVLSLYSFSDRVLWLFLTLS